MVADESSSQLFRSLAPLDRLAGVFKVWFYTYEPVHETSNNVVCATSKASDQPAHMSSLIRAVDSRLSIL